jgi:hypothetical protein
MGADHPTECWGMGALRTTRLMLRSKNLKLKIKLFRLKGLQNLQTVMDFFFVKNHFFIYFPGKTSIHTYITIVNRKLILV